MENRAAVFIEQVKDVALIEARLEAHRHGRGFVLRRVGTAAAVESLDAAAEAFARRPPGRMPVEAAAFDAARKLDVAQWWSRALVDVAPRMRAEDDCFESAECVRDLIETHELEAMDDRGEFNPPLEETYPADVAARLRARMTPAAH